MVCRIVSPRRKQIRSAGKQYEYYIIEMYVKKGKYVLCRTEDMILILPVDKVRTGIVCDSILRVLSEAREVVLSEEDI